MLLNQFEVGLGMFVDRADLERFGPLVDQTAVAASPAGRLVPGKKLP
jgi:hypothetical protein